MLWHTCQWNRTDKIKNYTHKSSILFTVKTCHAVCPVLGFVVCCFAFADMSGCWLMWPGTGLWSLPVADASRCSLSCRMSLSREASWCRLASIWPSVALTAARTSSKTPYREPESVHERYSWMLPLVFCSLNLTSLSSFSSSGTSTSPRMTLDPFLSLLSSSSFCCKVAVSWACWRWCSHWCSSVPCNKTPQVSLWFTIWEFWLRTANKCL